MIIVHKVLKYTVSITILIPIYKLDVYRLNNLKYILQHLSRCNYPVVTAEQIHTTSTLDLSEYANVTHVKYKNFTNKFNKSWLINTATNDITTSHIWVVDCDFYMDFAKLCIDESIYGKYNFIQPYYYARDLTHSQTVKLHKTDTPVVDCSQPELKQSRLINIYGALSYIYNKESFIEIGSMNENYVGWGYEDYDLFFRVHGNSDIPKYYIDKTNHGYHMYHNTSKEIDSTGKKNYKILQSYGYSLQNVNIILKKYYYMDWSFE